MSQSDDLDSTTPCTSTVTEQPAGAGAEVTRDDIAWAAGFADGEACLCIAKPAVRPGRRNPDYRVSLSITQNDRSVLEHFARVVGVPGRLYPTRREAYHRRQCYALIYSDSAAVRVTEVLAPHLVRKRQEAQAVASFWVEGRCGCKSGRRVTSEVLAARERHYQQMRALK